MKKLARLGVAENYDLLNLDYETFQSAIEKVIGDQSYSESMKTKSQAFQNQIKNPLEKALWWINWVLENPQVQITLDPEPDLCLLQRYSVDIIVFLLVSISIPLIIFSKFIFFAIYICYSNKPVRKIKRR